MLKINMGNEPIRLEGKFVYEIVDDRNGRVCTILDKRNAVSMVAFGNEDSTFVMFSQNNNRVKVHRHENGPIIEVSDGKKTRLVNVDKLLDLLDSEEEKNNL